MLIQRLLNRNHLFEQCQGCLTSTMQQEPLAKMAMKQDQLLCSACANTNLHIVPLKEIPNDALDSQIVSVYAKNYCPRHDALKKCKICRVYLNPANYSECPFCGFSFFRKDMSKWKILFPIYKCEVCYKLRCLRCQCAPEFLGSEEGSVFNCANCEEIKQSRRRKFREFLKVLPSCLGVQFLFAVVCIILFTPFQVMVNTHRRACVLLWRPLYSTHPFRNLHKLLFVMLAYPVLWLLLFLLRFFPDYWACLKENIAQFYFHSIAKRVGRRK